MAIPNSRSESEQAFARLEQKIDKLAKAYTAVKQENQILKHKQEELVRQKAKLMEKTSLAKSRVESMISRLKAMGSGS